MCWPMTGWALASPIPIRARWGRALWPGRQRPRSRPCTRGWALGISLCWATAWAAAWPPWWRPDMADRKSTRLNSSHLVISYAVFCLKKKKKLSLGHDRLAGDQKRTSVLLLASLQFAEQAPVEIVIFHARALGTHLGGLLIFRLFTVL